MSPLVVLGALGTLFSTITILPHVARAVRTQTAGGSPLAWAMGAAGGAVWLAYGIASGDLLVGAPGLITIPAGVMLAVWSARDAAPVHSTEALEAATLAGRPDGIHPVPGSESMPPTLEMPAVA